MRINSDINLIHRCNLIYIKLYIPLIFLIRMILIKAFFDKIVPFCTTFLNFVERSKRNWQ